MSDELRFHVEKQTEANIAAGMMPEEARRQARLQLGSVEGMKENCREQRRGFGIEALSSNVRYGLRMMRRDPGFTLVVVLTLALGIGANSAVFSAIDAILLRPLPFPNGDQLMCLSQRNTKGASVQTFVAPVRVEDWNRMNSTFQAITGYYTDDASETSGTLPEKVTEAFVAPRFLQVWGIAPALGRDFTPEPLFSGELCREKLDSTQPDILVNHSFANTYLPQSSPLGRHIVVPGRNNFLTGGEIRGIVGNAREQGLDLAPSPIIYWCISAPMPDPHYLVRTRTEPGTLAQTIREKIHELEPARSVFGVMPLTEHLDESFAENRLRMVLLGFFAATAVSLACVGLYGTLSYSVSVRQREVGLRLALGALRRQIVKRFLFQGLGVTLLGCAAGCALAFAFARLLSGMLYGVSPNDAATLSGVVVVVLIVAVLASLVPAVRAARVEPMRALRNE